MLLTDEEIEAMFAKASDGYAGIMQNDVKFARAIEAAILAKLASAELPEPATVTVLKEIPYYTYDQLCEAYAQGAASQLAEKPTCWAIFTEGGNARMWSTFQQHVQKLADAEGLTVTPLYTRRQA